MPSKLFEPRRSRVTLIVYGWDENEPGTLSWVFPSLRAATRAVRALRNAVRWLIVAGPVKTALRETVDLDEVRRNGLVLLESFA